MVNKYSFGKTSENIAQKYLEKNNYKILSTNWRFSKFGEIDIVAEDKNEFVFIEVKSKSSSVSEAKEMVTFKKQRKLIKLASLYLHTKRIKNKKCRFDVIALKINSDKIELEHIKNAFY